MANPVAAESWKARDNVAMFINWARVFGVPEAVMFETEDLVMVRGQRFCCVGQCLTVL